MRRMLLLFCSALIVAHGTAFSDEAQSLFHQGNQLYEQGDYAGAVEVYERILSDGKQSWQLYFNLGNAYYKLNRTGHAILNYERALELNSENEDIRFNLQLANLATVDRIPVPPKAEWIQWVEGIFFSLSFSTLTWLTIGCYAALLLLLTMRNIKPEYNGKIRFRTVQRILLPLFLIFAIWFGFRWYKIETERFAVVLPTEVSVTSSPVAEATEVFALHEGTKVKIEQAADGWIKIRLQDGKVGWLQASALGMI